jgi:hypothetical protein
MTSVSLPLTLRRYRVPTAVMSFARTVTADAPVLVGVLVLLGLWHSVNMGNFPFYHDDEGTYISQAWAVVSEGRLAPYTYWYDHAPLGWIQLALLSVLTGGFHAFGSAVQSGRESMLIFQLASAFLVYRIARSVSGSILVGVLATILFGLSAYGVYYHRRILLDNVTTFWMLLSIQLLVGTKRLTLVRVWASALALAVSILSKELTIFLVPAMGLFVFLRAHPSQRWLATAGWTAISGAAVSMYVLMATLKGELFPTGTLLGGTSEHVSLLGTLAFQASRGRDGGVLQAGSGFWAVVTDWAQQEPLLVICGTSAAFMSLLLIKRHREVAMMGLLTLSLWLFLARGGIVLTFYLVPLLPLLALNLALLTWAVTEQFLRATTSPWKLRALLGRTLRLSIAAVLLVLLIPGYVAPNIGFAANPLQLWTSSQAVAERQAVDWIRRYVSPESLLVVDDYAWLDLHDTPGQTSYPLAHYYWKVGTDPEISDGVFENDWRNADYILATPGVLGDAGDSRMTLVKEMVTHSSVVAHFDTGGWPVSIYRINKLQSIPATSDAILQQLWARLRQGHITQGRVVDSPSGSTSAASQATAMLQAAYMRDRATFDTLWTWSQAHLLSGGGLMTAKWQPSEQLRPGSVPLDIAATQDTALALIFADRAWGGQYREDAAGLLDSLWNQATVPAGLWRVPALAQNVSHNVARVSLDDLAPAAYRIFAELDARHDWTQVLNGTYKLLNSSRSLPGLGAGVLPDTVTVSSGGVVTLPSDVVVSSLPAMHAGWQFALDWVWSGALGSRTSAATMDVVRTAVDQQHSLTAAYNLDGSQRGDPAPIAEYASAVGILLAGTTPDDAHQVLAERILLPTLSDSQHSAADLLAAWNATAMLNGGLVDLLSGQNSIVWANVKLAGATAHNG